MVKRGIMTNTEGRVDFENIRQHKKHGQKT